MVTKLKQFRDSQLDTTGDVVGFYEREFYTFSNFSSFQVEWNGRLWPTSEHAYQAAHFFDTAPELVEEIFNAGSAHVAFKIAKANVDKAPKNWHDIRVEIMEDICWHKLNQHEYVQKKLLQTEDIYMVEDSPKDPFWGWGEDKQGRNELGKVWMKLRDKFRQK
ncbi:MAG: NADAR family protein [Patescibacteria group bacterium]|nr:NADAR family protein [Patescibacteria group bacterium]